MADTTLPGLLLAGNHASRPAATAVGTGALYACSTHGLIYQSNGATWSTWATLGGGAASGVTFTPAGTIAATDVQAAIEEVASEAGGGGTADDGGILVQSYNWAAKNTGQTIVFGAAPTDGNLLILVFASNQYDLTAITQTGVTWTRVLYSVYNSGNVYILDVWQGVVGAGASATATLTMNGTNTQYVTAFEYSGLTTIDAFNRAAGAGGAGTQNLALPWKKPGGRVLAGFVGGAANNPDPAPSYWTARGGSPVAVGFGRAWWGDYDAEADAANGATFLDHLFSSNSAQTSAWTQVILHLTP